MSFILEVSKNGKDTILFNNYKYRESYTVKSGDIVWKCLGRNCKATIKTDGQKTAIFFSSEAHNGPHPVTMRALTPTPPRKSCSTVNAPKSASVLPHCSTYMSTPLPNHTPNETLEVQQPSGAQCTPPISNDLLAENLALKEELRKVREELKVILDHSIDSDQRLLQFTETVFLPPQPKATHSSQLEVKSRTLVSSATQTEGSSNCHPEYTPLDPCQTCKILKEEVVSMIESMRCMEAENKNLKNIAFKSKTTPPTPSFISPSTPCQFEGNRFDSLQEEGSDQTQEISDFITIKRKKKRGKNKQHFNTTLTKCNIKHNTKKINVTRSNSDIAFNGVTIIGDSHVRNLAGFVGEKIGSGPVISGVCKPGAGLLSIKPKSPPPSQNHCFVLMAGTNDIDKGREDLIYNHMEEVLQVCKETSNVLVVPLTTRYDLAPSSPIQRTVSLVNNFIFKLCHRMQGVKVVDISRITRRHYTSHGLHLRNSGKRLLANLIVENIKQLKPLKNQRRLTQANPKPADVAEAVPSPPPSASQPSSTYAAVISKPRVTRKSTDDIQPPINVNSSFKNNGFLDEHSSATSPN